MKYLFTFFFVFGAGLANAVAPKWSCSAACSEAALFYVATDRDRKEVFQYVVSEGETAGKAFSVLIEKCGKEKSLFNVVDGVIAMAYHSLFVTSPATVVNSCVKE